CSACFLDEPVQRDEVLTVQAEQHTRSPLCRQVRPDLPQPASHCTAKRHPHRPPPLRPQQVLAYGLPVLLWHFLEPFPHRLSSRKRAEKDQRDFLRLKIFSHPCTLLSTLYVKMCRPAQRR